MANWRTNPVQIRWGMSTRKAECAVALPREIEMLVIGLIAVLLFGKSRQRFTRRLGG